MSNKLIGIISNEGSLKGVIEDDNFDVQVQITESGPRGLPGPKGDKGDIPKKGVDYMTVEDINEIKEGLELDVEIEAATIEEIQRLF